MKVLLKSKNARVYFFREYKYAVNFELLQGAKVKNILREIYQIRTHLYLPSNVYVSMELGNSTILIREDQEQLEHFVMRKL